jgi:hypothetical protein
MCKPWPTDVFSCSKPTQNIHLCISKKSDGYGPPEWDFTTERWLLKMPMTWFGFGLGPMRSTIGLWDGEATVE